MLGEIGEKARTTAEEFLKIAKEKTDDVAEGTKETVQETKEVVLGESDDDKDKFKQRVEQGRYDQKQVRGRCSLMYVRAQSWPAQSH
ncbi:hypothetical protein ACQJBY_058475 [Aegilops geniculata]